MASRSEDGTVTGDFLDELPNFHIDTFSELEEHSRRLVENKKSCVLCRNFISIYKINRTLHGCLGIRIKIKFYLLVLKVSLTRSLRSLVRDTFST